MSDRPRISVVVPSFRRPDLLPRLLASFEAQDLPFDEWELLVVDNGSGDETSDVLAGLAASTPVDLRPLRIEENHGPAAARNLGWRSARAPLVAFTDDDCVPAPGWLRWGLTTLESDPGIGVVQGRTLKPTTPYRTTRWTTYREVLTPSPWFEGCNLFFRREALEATGGFDESILFGAEDTVAGWSVLERGWSRAFDEAAVVRHDLGERGLRWHMLMAWREGTLLEVARRHPSLRREGFWRPWALRPGNVAFAAGVAGTAVAAATGRLRWAPLAWLPWFQLRRPPFRTPSFVRYVGERWLIDATVFATMTVASVRYRQLTL